MVDPLSEVIALLRPEAVFTKGISGAGRWAVRYGDFGHPSFCTVVEGRCRLVLADQEPRILAAGDFVLLPRTPGFTISGMEPALPAFIDPRVTPTPEGDVRHGTPDGPADVRLLGGYFVFASDNADLVVSLLPALIHIRGAARLSLLMQMLVEEAAERRPGRDLTLARIVDLLLIEALRSMQGEGAPPGLLRGLSDPRLAEALRQMHGDPARPWTVGELAKRVALSRSGFFDRFARAVGLAPMEYLLAWRMAIARDLLRRGETSIADIAERIGYGSASAFSTAFSRAVGQPPGRYARAADVAAADGTAAA